MNTYSLPSTTIQPRTTDQQRSHGTQLHRILVVDDETAFTRLLKINLEATRRYLVQVENDPTLALPAALDFHPELVLLDVMMPGIDGGDVANRFRQHPELQRIPIIFLTATVRHAEVNDHAGSFGGLRFLAKPVNLAQLLECLDQHFAE
jgi:two-component system, OmpR family, response regulator